MPYDNLNFDHVANRSVTIDTDVPHPPAAATAAAKQQPNPTWLHFQHQCLPQFVHVILLQPSFFMVAMPQTGQLLLAVAMNFRFMA